MKIAVKAKPNASRQSVTEHAGAYTVEVKEPPIQGQANAAIVRALAEHFGVAKERVRIVSGHTSRSKMVEIGDAVIR